MNITFRTLPDNRIAAKLEGSPIEGFGTTQEEATQELKRWLDIIGNIKWIDAFTGQEVKN